MPIITFDETKRHLKVDHDEDDDEITEIAADASALILNYLKVPEDQWQDTNLQPASVPRPVRAAALKVAAALYENRDGSGTPALSQDVKDMVHRFRDPALA